MLNVMTILYIHIYTAKDKAGATTIYLRGGGGWHARTRQTGCGGETENGRELSGRNRSI